MIYVFIGPSLSVEDASAELNANFLPPVSQGDVYRASLNRPLAIGIIDGYFDRVPAVWHKEILWAMSQGIHVFGSASMGALRAAELASFGMIGVGNVYEDYRDGLLHDDDEVALAHAPAEIGYRTLSEPMVNIRYTLRKANVLGVIQRSTFSTLEQIAKSMFYPDRTYPKLLQEASEQGLEHEELKNFLEWLPDNQVNQKRDDALLMLRTMADFIKSNPKPKEVDFVFEHTTLWDELTRSAGTLRVKEDSIAEMITIESLFDELKLDNEMYAHAQAGAMLRILKLDEARRHGIEITEEILYQTIISFRERYNLIEREDLERWLKENNLNQKQFLHFMEEEARLKWVESLLESETARTMTNHLRAVGLYAGFLDRLRRKM